MKRTYIYSAIVATGLFVAGCSSERVHASGIEPSQVKVEAAPDPNVMEVEHPETLSLTTVQQRRTYSELTVPATISADVSRTVPVLSLTGGRVVEVRAKLGDYVEKGQTLLVINSNDVAQSFSDYEKAVADETLARRQYERTQLLFSRGALAEKELQTAEDAEDKAKVDLHTAAQRIRILGGDIERPSPLIEVRAPTSGTIIEQNVQGGTGVKSIDNSPNLFTIADMSHVWILSDVYENNLGQVHLGDAAEVRLNAYPDRVFRGRVSNIGTVLDPQTRAVKVRVELPNIGGLLRAGMFATSTFRSQTEQVRPAVPATAVLRLHDKDWVFKPEGGNRFRRLEIQASTATPDGYRPVLAGVGPGQKIVANALQFASAGDME